MVLFPKQYLRPLVVDKNDYFFQFHVVRVEHSYSNNFYIFLLNMDNKQHNYHIYHSCEKKTNNATYMEIGLVLVTKL